MTASVPTAVTVNGRTYRFPAAPTVIVCIDGSEPAYMEEAVKAGRMPWLARTLPGGADLRADCVVPSFTNPNNLSIVTGAPPSVHGISGNFFYNPALDAEVMMNEPEYLRAPTLFPAFRAAGAKVAIVTAKDKLRRLLGHGMAVAKGEAICFSSEKADIATVAENGIDGVLDQVGLPLPSVYSADLSRFVFAAGVKIMAAHRPDLMYLSTTDYIQHKHAPGTPVANDFYAMMDGYLAELDAMGCVIALTADHGMNAKHGTDGKPQVIWLQSVLDDIAGPGARVILPITDPYVVHHGALGSYATAYLPQGADITRVLAALKAMDGIEAALTKAEAAERFGLPPDRIGDIVVVSTTHITIGTSADRHDLSGLDAPLRSHGGISEQTVPLVFNRKVTGLPERRLRNFDILDIALNHTAAARAEAAE